MSVCRIWLNGFRQMSIVFFFARVPVLYYFSFHFKRRNDRVACQVGLYVVTCQKSGPTLFFCHRRLTLTLARARALTEYAPRCRGRRCRSSLCSLLSLLFSRSLIDETTAQHRVCETTAKCCFRYFGSLICRFAAFDFLCVFRTHTPATLMICRLYELVAIS